MGKDCDVTGLATASALLGVGSVSIDGMPLAVNPEIRVPVRVVAGGFPDDRLALAVAPGRRDDDGG
jgi:hypothetical protein